MTDAHKEQAREIAKRYTREGTGYADRLYQLAYAIEQALATRDTEVREVLEGFGPREDRYAGGLCRCDKNLTDSKTSHSKHCEAVSELYGKVSNSQSQQPETPDHP